MALLPVQKQFLQRCQQSPSFFISQLAYIQHPTFGKMRFNLFDYQVNCIKDFLQYRLNIFHKIRQSGISTLCGAFALWRAMFFKDKTILVVSKTDETAMEFLRRNVKYVYENLPPWIQDLWPVEQNEHRMVFHNGSRISSLTSAPNTLRSNSSTLNIIDEAAFMPKMEEMWAGGWPTLSNGGNVIVISTPNGIGNWYWRTVNDAISGDSGILNGQFHLIKINWWDMNYRLEGVDAATNRKVIISPTAGLVDCVSKEDLIRFGPKKSPWLEEQYRGMVSRGEDQFFKQEYLRTFLGTGNTVIPSNQLQAVELSVDGDGYGVVGTHNYVNPGSKTRATLDFDEKLWIWKQPQKGHIYVAGVDTSSGEAHDYSGVVVWDVTDGEQVAELRIRVRPKTLAMMVDYIGRLYNSAMVVVERNSIGVTVVQELYQDLSYPAIYREERQSKRLRKTLGSLGFTTGMKSKGELNAALQNYIGVENGFEVKSPRLKNEMDIYIYKTKGGQTGAEDGPGNTDDLVIASALGLIGVAQASKMSGSLPPPLHDVAAPNVREKRGTWDEMHQDMVKKYGGGANRLAIPLIISSEEITQRNSAANDVAGFMTQMQSKWYGPDGKKMTPNIANLPVVSHKKNPLA